MNLDTEKQVDLCHKCSKQGNCVMNPPGPTHSCIKFEEADKSKIPCCDSPGEDKCTQCQEIGNADPKNQW